MLLGLLAVLLESSFMAVPLTLVWVWSVSNRKVVAVLWWSFLMGVTLDLLTMRWVGSVGVIISVFLAGLWFIRRQFTGLVYLEWGWLLISMLVWQKAFLGGDVIGVLLLWGVAVFSFWIQGRLNLGGDIRLR